MKIKHAIQNIFVQLSESLKALSPEEYVHPSRVLFNATIGQHVRHIIELFIELEKGYTSGVVNYENRKRDHRIETNKDFACELLHAIYASVERPDKYLLLEANYDEDSKEMLTIQSNYYREVVYNLEHTVHHMALIRVGINEVSNLQLPEGFGVASSTIKYRRVCAQ
ncbi:MAG TPA: hypothetical protein VG738_17745 [Chitinophagaceae bacterium]|nr:hypothetical protein [Chitinophagaceae bacterium]